MGLLDAWITKARLELASCDRVDIGDLCIGHLLSGSQMGKDGIWPMESVRDVVETLNSDSLREGLEVDKLSTRGMTTRGAFDGGLQEDALAEAYEKDARQVATKWPATARVLRNLLLHYREVARREDIHPK